MATRKTIRVWVLFRANPRHAQGAADPGLELEGFTTVRDAKRIIGQRIALGTGTAYYVHPDREADRQWTHWADNDKDTAYAEVWLYAHHTDTPPGWEPDATSQPDEKWTHKGLLGVERTPY
jgi:hypothetical protein